MTKVRWVCGVLLCVVCVCGEDKADGLDRLLAAKVEETQRSFADVEQQLSAARQVAVLFALEDAQLQMLALETRAKLVAVQEEVRLEMEMAELEVDGARRAAGENVTTWEKTLRGLRDATQRNRQVLQRIKEKKLEELEQQKEQELKAKRELERLQELEKQRELEQLEALEKEQELQQLLDKMRELEKQQKLEKQLEQEAIQKARRSDLAKSSDGPEETLTFDDTERSSMVKRLLACYMSAEQTVLQAGTAICRQFLLPVAVILSLFLVLTVVIAKCNAMKQARRNRRVLYSGYPKSYQPKVQAEKPLMAEGHDLRPRYPNLLRDPNAFIGT